MSDIRRLLGFIFPWIAILALATIVIVPGLKGGFLFDDAPNIVDNNAVHITTLNFDSLKSSIAGPTAGPLGRPVSVISFAITHYFFGLDPAAFKTINLVIHLMNGLLVAWLAGLLLHTRTGSRLSDKAAIWLPRWVAAAWLIHPINVVPVMMAVQRMTLLSGMFTLLALIGHLKFRSTSPERPNIRWVWLAAGWLVFWPLSVLSKETGLLFPLYLLAITLLLPYTSHSESGKDSRTGPILVIVLLIIAATGMATLGWRWLDSAYVMRTFSLGERLLTEARVVWFYAAQIIAPDHAAFSLYFDDIKVSTNILHPISTALAVAGWIAVTIALFIYRRREPVLCFCATWFLVGHSLESTFLPLEIAQEYRNYLPSIGLILGVGCLGVRLLDKIKLHHRALKIGVMAGFPIFVLALFTLMRADQLGNPLTGPQIEVARHPLSARANYAAALALMQNGYGGKDDPILAQSIRFYLERAGKIDPTFKDSSLALIIWACVSGRTVENAWLDEFAYRLEHTSFAPGDLPLPEHMFTPMLAMPKCLARDDAIRLFVAGANNPKLTKSMRAVFLELASDYELLVASDPHSARTYLQKASALVPENVVLSQKLKGYERIK